MTTRGAFRCIQGLIQGLISEGEPKRAFELAREHGCCGEQIKLMLLQGFVACGELESALEMFGGFHEASMEMPREFNAFVRAIQGREEEAAEESAESQAVRMGEAGAGQGDADVRMRGYYDGDHGSPRRVQEGEEEGDGGGDWGLSERVEALERLAEEARSGRGAEATACSVFEAS